MASPLLSVRLNQHFASTFPRSGLPHSAASLCAGSLCAGPTLCCVRSAVPGGRQLPPVALVEVSATLQEIQLAEMIDLAAVGTFRLDHAVVAQRRNLGRWHCCKLVGQPFA